MIPIASKAPEETAMFKFDHSCNVRLYENLDLMSSKRNQKYISIKLTEAYPKGYAVKVNNHT